MGISRRMFGINLHILKDHNVMALATVDRSITSAASLGNPLTLSSSALSKMTLYDSNAPAGRVCADRMPPGKFRFFEMGWFSP
jgi:hypothetical protein